jgi:hypothetical protein
MKEHKSRSTSKAVAKAKADKPSVTPVVQSDCTAPGVFLEEAKKEPKRILLMDYIATIRTLRDEKKFTFRAIADWLGQRGVETDHSAVYRAYLAAIPEQDRWLSDNLPAEIDEPDFADENVTVKKP